MAKVKLDAAYYAECFDRCNTMVGIIEEIITGHPVVWQTPILKTKALAAASNLYAIASATKTKSNADSVIFDRVFWIMQIVYDQLIDNTEIDSDNEALALASAAGDNLWKLYQYLGNKHINTSP